jgi:hypothetical protein
VTRRTPEQRAELAAYKRAAPIGIPAKGERIDMSALPIAPPAPRVREAKGMRNGLKTYKRLGINAERQAARRIETHGEHAQWVATLQCCASFPELYESAATLKPYLMRTGQTRISDPHHVRTRGAGGTAEFCVPLDRPRHIELGQVGQETFESFYKIDLWRIAALLWECSPSRGDGSP